MPLVGWDDRSTDLTIHYQVNTIAKIIGLLQRVRYFNEYMESKDSRSSFCHSS